MFQFCVKYFTFLSDFPGENVPVLVQHIFRGKGRLQYAVPVHKREKPRPGRPEFIQVYDLDRQQDGIRQSQQGQITQIL
jgi:hypothetical protein